MNTKDAIRSAMNVSDTVLKTYLSDLSDADLLRATIQRVLEKAEIPALEQTFPMQASTVQLSPSSQSPADRQQPAMGSKAQDPPSQLSVVQMFPSSQSPSTVQHPMTGE